MPESPGSPNLQSLFSWYQTMYRDALAENENIYNQTVQGYRTREADIMTQERAMTNAQLEEANRYWEGVSADTEQSAYGRGLGNASIMSSLNQGVDEERAYDIRHITSDRDASRLGLAAQLSGDRLAYQGSYRTPSPGLETIAGIGSQLDQAAYRDYWLRQGPRWAQDYTQDAVFGQNYPAGRPRQTNPIYG